MTFAAVVLLALALRSVCGDSIGGLAKLHVRGEGFFLFVLVLVVAFPATSVLLHPPRNLVLPVWILLMGLLLGLCIANSRATRGFIVMAAGIALNLLVITANGAMPVSETAAMSVGGAAAAAAVRNGDIFHIAAPADTHFLLLGDILPLPGFPGFRAMLSVGDVLMFAGILIVVVAFSPATNVARRRASG